MDFIELLAAIGFEALFTMSRSDPRIVATNRDRKDFLESAVSVFIRPASVIGLLQLRHAVGFPILGRPQLNGFAEKR